MFGNKIRLLKGSLCICFLCLYIFQSLLPQFADFVTMAFKAPPERIAAVRGALTCIGKEQKGFRAGGSTTLYIKIALGSIAPWPWRQPCLKEPPVSLGKGRSWLTWRGRGVQQERVPSASPPAASCKFGMMCYQLTALHSTAAGWCVLSGHLKLRTGRDCYRWMQHPFTGVCMLAASWRRFDTKGTEK